MAQVKTASKSDPNYKVIAENRRARYDYAIEEDIECGIILEGSEVKSLRQGGANIAESYAAVEDAMGNHGRLQFSCANEPKHRSTQAFRHHPFLPLRQNLGLWSGLNFKYHQIW